MIHKPGGTESEVLKAIGEKFTPKEASWRDSATQKTEADIQSMKAQNEARSAKIDSDIQRNQEKRENLKKILEPYKNGDAKLKHPGTFEKDFHTGVDQQIIVKTSEGLFLHYILPRMSSYQELQNISFEDLVEKIKEAGLGRPEEK
ncbi:MAG: hypothetical protein PHQ18_01795 [Patescibacteria group bacterium]|nr:hypothetical protein [Patescibacteria group bacterium]